MTDTAKVKLLGRFFLRLETKGRDGSRKKLLMLFISYLIPGVFIPFLLYKQNYDSTGFYFTFLTFLFNSLILSFTIASEFDNLILTKPELDLMTSLPMDDMIMARAKIFLLVRYVTLISLPLLIPGSIYYYLIMNSILRAVLYFFSGLAFSIFLANVLLLIYGVAVKNLKIKRLGTYTLVFQVIFILLLIVSYQFVSFTFTGRYGGGVIRTFQRLFFNEDFTKFFPHTWFAFISVKQNTILDYRVLLKLSLPVFITYMSILSLRLYLIENYGKIREKFIYSRVLITNDNIQERKKTIFELSGELIQAIYIRNHIEHGAFGLMQSHFTRDKALRTSMIPMMIIPAGITIFALLTNQLPSPFAIAHFGLNPVFHISIFIAVLIVINTAVLGSKVTGNKDAAWVYDAFPLGTKKRLINGVRKFFVIYLIVPISIILFLLFSIQIPLDKSFIHVLYIFAFANLYNSLFHFISKTLPFTKDNTLMQSIHRLGAIFYPLVFGTGCVLLQIFVYRDIPLTLLAIAIVISVTFWLNFFAFVKGKD